MYYFPDPVEPTTRETSYVSRCCKAKVEFDRTKRSYTVWRCTMCQQVFTDSGTVAPEESKARGPQDMGPTIGKVCCQTHAPAAAMIHDLWTKLPECCR